jgi:hypothetical protein
MLIVDIVSCLIITVVCCCGHIIIYYIIKTQVESVMWWLHINKRKSTKKGKIYTLYCT